MANFIDFQLYGHFIFLFFLQNIFFLFYKRKITQVWNNIRVRKLWQTLNLWVIFQKRKMKSLGMILERQKKKNQTAYVEFDVIPAFSNKPPRWIFLWKSPIKACRSSSNNEEMLGTGCCNLTQTLHKYLDLLYIKMNVKLINFHFIR